MAFDFDLLVIGAGSGGVRAARMSAGYGARVGVIESTYLGGTCVNVGCVPKKLFVYGAHYSEDMEDARAYGWDAEPPEFDWPRLRDNKTREIERLNGIYRGLLADADVRLIEGHATFSDPHTVRVGDASYSAERILIATGGRPFVPDFPGCEHAITSEDAFYIERFPERALVVGGGYIAVEFAGIFNGLGAQTTLMYRGPLFLRGFDDGVREFVKGELDHKGVGLRFEDNVVRIEREGDTRLVHTVQGQVLEVDCVLAATGRKPNTGDLNIEACGVELGEDGAVKVDARYRTNVPHIYAIGDVIDRVQLTPVAIAEGMVLASNLFDGTDIDLDYDGIATAVFCQPNIGTVGLTEAQATQKYPQLAVYESSFRPMKHTLTGREERTLMKLLVNAADDRVVGAHMVGPEAGEIIQGLAVAMKAGATKAHFDATMAIHPTAAEEFVTMRQVARGAGA